jgi:hypothetical protein
VIKQTWRGIDRVAERDKRGAVDTSIAFCYFCCAACLPVHLSALRAPAGVQHNSLCFVY